MSRRRAQIKRQVEVDPVYGTRVITKFINSLMLDGKKQLLKKLFTKHLKLLKRNQNKIHWMFLMKQLKMLDLI